MRPADRPAQLLRPTPAPVRLIELTDVPDAEAVAWNWMRTDLETAVDVSRDPLFEHAVLRPAPDRHLFHLRYHHVILDGFGQVVYWRRVAQHYAGLRTGTPVPPAPFAELATLVEGDEDYARSGQHEVDRAYWHELLADRPESVSLRRPGLGGSPARRHQPWVELGNAREAATGLGTHWSVLVLAAIAAYVARLTQQAEVVLGFRCGPGPAGPPWPRRRHPLAARSVLRAAGRRCPRRYLLRPARSPRTRGA